MQDSELKKVTAFSGIASFILFIIASVLLASTPDISASDDVVLKWLRENRSIILTAIYTWGLCVSATFFFLTGFWNISKKEEVNSSVYSTLGLAGGFSIFTLALAGFIPALIGAYRAESINADTARMLSDLTLLSVNLTGFPTVVSVIGFSVVIQKTKYLPKWLVWFGYFVCLLHLLSAGAFANTGLMSPSGIGVYIAPVFYYIWILIISILLYKKN